MTDSELEKLLKSTPLPEKSADYWEDFPRRVQAGIHAASVGGPRAQHSWKPRLAWAVSFSVLCLAVGFAIGQWRGKEQGQESYALLQNGQTVKEILDMFPNRVRAILQTERGVELVLSEKPDVPNSAPLWIKVGEGKEGQAAVTFSGQEIQIGGEKMTVLADSQGGVILMAKQMIWSSTAPNQAGNKVKIEAKSLGTL